MMYAWAYTSRVYHIVEEAGRGWRAHQGGERWVDVSSETPPADRVPCACAVPVVKAQPVAKAKTQRCCIECGVVVSVGPRCTMCGNKHGICVECGRACRKYRTRCKYCRGTAKLPGTRAARREHHWQKAQPLGERYGARRAVLDAD